MQTVDFGTALLAAEKGKRIARKDWNGKGMYVYRQVPCEIHKDFIPNMQSLPEFVKDDLIKRDLNICFNNQYSIVYPDSQIFGWVASPSDISAKDWVILD